MYHLFRHDSLADLRRGFAGRPYAKLVEAHIKKQGSAQLHQALLGTIGLFPPEEMLLASKFIDRWVPRAYDHDFWEADCALIFDQIVADADGVLRSSGLPSESEVVFNLFQVVTLNFAFLASAQPEMQSFLKIHRLGLLQRVARWVHTTAARSEAGEKEPSTLKAFQVAPAYAVYDKAVREAAPKDEALRRAIAVYRDRAPFTELTDADVDVLINGFKHLPDPRVLFDAFAEADGRRDASMLKDRFNMDLFAVQALRAQEAERRAQK